MWVITNTAFVSIVEHRDDPKLLIVRGRFQGDVSRFLRVPGELQPIEECTPHADYRYRATVSRELVSQALLREVGKVRYPNFKDSIVAKWRKALALRVWSLFHAAQDQRAGLARSAARASGGSAS